MGLCPEADSKPPAVKRPAGNDCVRQTSTQEVVEAIRSDAFASPGSPLGLPSVVGFLLITNNPGQLSTVGCYPSVDDLGNIVIDIAAIGVRPVVKFDHLLAFFLGMGFHRSERGRHDLDSGRAHQIES